MIGRLFIFTSLLVFSQVAFAEYYLVYTPPQCVDCVGPFPPVSDHKHQHKQKHHVRQSKPVATSMQRNACGECEKCICGKGYAISTSSPQYDGEHCTTYDDELRGRGM